MLRKTGGQSLVEFALALPLLVALFVGMVRFGILLYDYIIMTDAVYVGARTMATNRSAGAGPPTACALGESALTGAAYNLSQGSITIGPEAFSGTSTCSALQSGDSGTMSATYPCNMSIPFLGSFWPNCKISMQTTVRIE